MNEQEIRSKLYQCASNDERIAMCEMLSSGIYDKDELISSVISTGSRLHRRWVGNEFNGWYVYDFAVGECAYTYSPHQGADGSGKWYLKLI